MDICEGTLLLDTACFSPSLDARAEYSKQAQVDREVVRPEHLGYCIHPRGLDMEKEVEAHVEVHQSASA